MNDTQAPTATPKALPTRLTPQQHAKMMREFIVRYPKGARVNVRHTDGLIHTGVTYGEPWLFRGQRAVILVKQGEAGIETMEDLATIQVLEALA